MQNKKEKRKLADRELEQVSGGVQNDPGPDGNGNGGGGLGDGSASEEEFTLDIICPITPNP